jgi:hypothetical protein
MIKYLYSIFGLYQIWLNLPIDDDQFHYIFLWMIVTLAARHKIHKQAIMDDHYIGCITKFIIKKTLPWTHIDSISKFSKDFQRLIKCSNTIEHEIFRVSFH